MSVGGKKGKMDMCTEERVKLQESGDWKINVKMLIHINTNMIYNIVPLAVLVWSFRMSAMYFAF